MNVTLINSPAMPDNLCGTAAAICTGANNTQGALKGAMLSGHESVAEHASFTFHIEGVSRVLLAQLTRHRMASYSVQSQRYCGITPKWVVPPEIVKHGMGGEFLAQCDSAYALYQTMISNGVLEEDARYVIPQAITCDLILTMNARELRHFFSLRMCNRAQWEIQELADMMHAICVSRAPILFKNSGCGCMTTKGCPEGKRSCGQPRS